MAQMKTRGK